MHRVCTVDSLGNTLFSERGPQALEVRVVDEQLFKDVMARIPTGVAVITSVSERGFHGVTVSSFGSLSLDPPLVYACILREIQSHDLLAAADRFVINVLAREHTFYADQFSGQAPLADPSFAKVRHHLGATGVPRIDGCISWIECRHWQQYAGGDHTIFVGEIDELLLGTADDPLIYYDREFAELGW
jgi:flavin reductase (DIM6/NTAB) family NADH-FMN oxidoreductase RutF